MAYEVTRVACGDTELDDELIKGRDQSLRLIHIILTDEHWWNLFWERDMEDGGRFDTMLCAVCKSGIIRDDQCSFCGRFTEDDE